MKLRSKRQRVARTFSCDCPDCGREHALYEDVLDEDGQPIWDEREATPLEEILIKIPLGKRSGWDYAKGRTKE